MKYTDMRISQTMMTFLNSLVHQRLYTLIYDPYQFIVVPYMNVYLEYGDNLYVAISNQRQDVDYYGEKTTMAVMSVECADETDDNENAHHFTINREIDSIQVINETQKLVNGDECVEQVDLTRAVIVRFTDGVELSFEKQCVPYSEEINVEEGRDLIELIDIPEYFLTHFETCQPACSRTVINLKGY